MFLRLLFEIAKNDYFGGNLIWRMVKNVNFGEFLTNPPNPPKFLPLRYILTLLASSKLSSKPSKNEENEIKDLKT